MFTRNDDNGMGPRRGDWLGSLRSSWFMFADAIAQHDDVHLPVDMPLRATFPSSRFLGFSAFFSFGFGVVHNFVVRGQSQTIASSQSARSRERDNIRHHRR